MSKSLGEAVLDAAESMLNFREAWMRGQPMTESQKRVERVSIASARHNIALRRKEIADRTTRQSTRV